MLTKKESEILATARMCDGWFRISDLLYEGQQPTLRVYLYRLIVKGLIEKKKVHWSLNLYRIKQ